MTSPFAGVPTAARPAPLDATSAGPSGARQAADSSLGPDAFMKLLLAQLKYQNPMAPADGQQYMSQMATFAQVEKLDALVQAQADAVRWQQRVSAEGLVGRTVSSTSADGVTTTGTVTGVRYGTAGGPLLELSSGGTMQASAVDHVAAGPPPGPVSAR